MTNNRNWQTMSKQTLATMLSTRQPQGHFVLMVGIPGSGKSTLSSEFASLGYTCLSRDIIRAELLGMANNHSQEDKVTEAFQIQLQQALNSGCNIVIDNTNIEPDHRKSLIDEAKAQHYDGVDIIIFDLAIEECLRRNSQRSKVVPQYAIERMYNKLTRWGKPVRSEGRRIFLRQSGNQNYLVHFAK